jgi:peroxiredoxin family protein
MAKMVIGLVSGGIDRLTAAGIVASGAAALDMDIEIYVLLMGARAFKKENAENIDELSETPQLKDQFFAGLEKNQVKKWYQFLKDVKELTNVKILVCGLAGKIWGGEKIDDFVDLVDDICGVGEYVDAATNADLHLFI